MLAVATMLVTLSPCYIMCLHFLRVALYSWQRSVHAMHVTSVCSWFAGAKSASLQNPARVRAIFDCLLYEAKRDVSFC